MPFVFEDEARVNIKVVGIGGGGSAAVNHMINSDIGALGFIDINTDKTALELSNAPVKICIGEKPRKGYDELNLYTATQAVRESSEEIASALRGADIVFITAGMGGVTGAAAAPVVAKIAKSQNILTIGIVTTPFAFEGKKRAEQAQKNVSELRKAVDSLIIIPCEKLRGPLGEKASVANLFKEADAALQHGVECIKTALNGDNYINLDLVDIVSVVKNGAEARIGIGFGNGGSKAETAARTLISSPLLESSLQNAESMIMKISVSPDTPFDEIEVALAEIKAEAPPEADIIWCAEIDEMLDEEINITAIVICAPMQTAEIQNFDHGNHDALAYAKNSFDIEAKAIIETGENMDWPAFSAAVALLAKAERIAASGCGHSGIACRHFAHSMCCIERPARFISPSEAVHGAAGFIGEGDVLVVASRGGKTSELMPVIEIANKKKAFVISVTENTFSPMAVASDVVLPMKVPREADRYDAQGTSSFAALSAVFDALQVAVMEETGYDGSRFALVHPGGAVGQRLNNLP